jgi:lipopolysaccharide transport system permease protein
MRFVVPLLTQVWMYATPIVYPVSVVPESLQPIYFLNPMAGIIDGYRRALILGQQPRLEPLLVGAFVSFALLLFGYVVFKRAEPFFADLI